MWQSRQFEFKHGAPGAANVVGPVVGRATLQTVHGVAVPGAAGTVQAALAAAWPHIPQLAQAPLPWALSIRLGAPDEGARLNRDFRGADYVPDVLSFPTDDDDAQTDGADDFYLGDIFITAEKCAADAAAQNKPVAEHLAHLVVHGLLHLCGHDHEAGPTEEAAMQALEIKILASLNIPNPYAGDAV